MQRIFIALLILLGFISNAQQKEWLFGKFNSELGLSSNWVRDIGQDSSGYIWFATNDGVNRYDGTVIKVFKKKDNDARSILNNYVRCLHVDRKGTLWVGFNGGLSEYNKDTEDFTNYINNPNNPSSLPSNKVADIASDNSNKIWVLLRDQGLCYFEPNHYVFKKVEMPGYASGDFERMLFDRNNRIWITTNGMGLICFDPSSKKVTTYKNDKIVNTYSIFEDSNGKIWFSARESGLWCYENEKMVLTTMVEAGATVQTIAEDTFKKLWVSLENDGVLIYSLKENKVERKLLHTEFDPSGISHNSINSILRDRDGNMWLGTFATGVNLLKVPNNVFGHHFRKVGAKNTLSYNPVLSFLEDKNGLWIGTDNGGLNFVDNKTGTYRLFDVKNSQLKSNVILSLAEGNNESIWVGTYQQGLYEMNKSTGRCTRYLDNYSIGSLVVDKVNSILWIGTWGDGLVRFDLKTKQYVRFNSVPEDIAKINDNFVFQVYLDRANKLWICTSTGLHLLEDPINGKFKRFLKENKNDRSIISNNVYTCYEDTKNRFWIGTSEGLCIMNRDSFNFTPVNKSLFNNLNILNMLEDKNQNLWIATYHGLHCYNHQTSSIKIFKTADGTQSEQFSNKAFLALSTGELVFGGVNGFNRFFPQEVLNNQKVGTIRLYDLIVNEKTVAVGSTKEGEFSIPVTVSQLNELELGPDQNNFRISYSSINFNNPGRLSFAYKLEGFDSKWINGDLSHVITYTNLEPGDYVLKVRSWLHSENEANFVKELKIKVRPPFYRSWWFLTLIGIGFVYVLYKLYGWSISALKRRQIQLEAKVKDRTRQIEKQKEEIEILYNELEDSIDAAKTIQYNMLPSPQEINKHFSNHYLLYWPKHKVSGDFYWLKEVDNKVYFSLIDCTGHGVPGAFLTMIASDKLDNLVGNSSGITVAGVLDKLNHEVIKTLRDPGEEFHMDGMDISLCEWDKETQILKFAGAKMSVIVQKKNEFIITKGHRFSIGTHKVGTHLEFTISELKLEKGDRIFLMTDGFTDQLGGDLNQKFLLKRVISSLEENVSADLKTQGESLKLTFDKWRGETPQLDDITLWFLEV